jgi:hypothetical protein
MYWNNLKLLLENPSLMVLLNCIQEEINVLKSKINNISSSSEYD